MGDNRRNDADLRRDHAASHPKPIDVRSAPVSRALTTVLTIPVMWAGAFLISNSLIAGEPAAPPLSDCGVGAADVEGMIRHAESVRVVVAIDEEWAGGSGGNPETEARTLLASASVIFRGVGIRFMPVRIVPWASPNEARSARQMLDSVRESVPVDGAHIVVALSGQITSDSDGRAEVLGRHAFIRRHPGRQDLDALVLAHEISHLFGAGHGCDVPGIGGVMTLRGFDEMFVLCPCTRQVLLANAHRFHAEASG